MIAANRGKKAEGLLDKEFKKLDIHLPNFTYERIYDARSSMGKMANPRAGDFCLYHEGANILLEVKEVAHAYRLPVGNFDLAQRARMKKRQLAGSAVGVIVYHSTTDAWRLQPLEWFGTLNTGSWNFLGMEELKLSDVIRILTTDRTRLL